MVVGRGSSLVVSRGLSLLAPGSLGEFRCCPLKDKKSDGRQNYLDEAPRIAANMTKLPKAVTHVSCGDFAAQFGLAFLQSNTIAG